MKITFLIAVTSAAVLLSSCNTMIGLGRDMRMGGEGLENTSNKVSGNNTNSGNHSNTNNSGAPVY
jgi:predicted small secreted protein